MHTHVQSTKPRSNGWGNATPNPAPKYELCFGSRRLPDEHFHGETCCFRTCTIHRHHPVWAHPHLPAASIAKPISQRSPFEKPRRSKLKRNTAAPHHCIPLTCKIRHHPWMRNRRHHGRCWRGPTPRIWCWRCRSQAEKRSRQSWLRAS
jgi:hypothetical protein